MKKWINKTDLLEIRPAEDGEMVAHGQFAKLGDMVIVHAHPNGNFLIRKQEFKSHYVEVMCRLVRYERIVMYEYIAELYEQWVNGNRMNVCRKILNGTRVAATSVCFTIKLIESTPGGLFFGQQEAGIFASLLENNGE